MTVPISSSNSSNEGLRGRPQDSRPQSSNEEIFILSARTNPDAFERILTDPALAEIEAHPYTGAFGRAYYPAIHDGLDHSFTVCMKGAPALVCLCAPLDGNLGFHGMPLRLIIRGDLGDDARRAVIDSTFQHLDALMQAQRLQKAFVLVDRERGRPLIEEVCRARGGTMSLRSVACVDLTAGPAAWRSALRKSSRSLINWGRRNLSISYVSKDAPDRALFDQYRAFHAEVAGRVTRSDVSWTVMFDWIARGNGELIMAFLSGQLVAGSMFIDGTEISIYASGVYDRAQFDRPLAHYPLWLGIERAQARGMRTLELGEVPLRDTVPEKEYQIGYFKRGFATHIVEQAIWRWTSQSQVAV